jgi:selenide,water dikinase
LAGIETIQDPAVLVGYETSDDAGVYLLDEETVLLQSVDFFTPIVDDPFIYGQVAAANALSDIYAMGGVPKFALSIVAFPDGLLEESVLGEALRGGVAKMKEAAVPVIGGHSVRDAEMKFGYVVTGQAERSRLYRNTGVRAGDSLILTKPLGTGVIATAIKFGACPPEVEEEAIRWMCLLNREASELLASFPVHAVTDVTGYGLLGHAYEMACASDACLQFQWKQIPLMGGVQGLVRQGMLPGAVAANRSLLGKSVRWDAVGETAQNILLDPQTSGGLLVAVPGEQADALLAEFRRRNVFAARVGSAVRRETLHITVAR